MPRIDVLMQSGRIAQWLKKEGERVSEGEPIALIEAEKTTFELEAKDAGVVRRILKEQGDDVPVGEVLALVGSLSEEIPDRYVTTEETEHRASLEVSPLATKKLAVVQEIRATPAARSLARQHELDLATVNGTGRGGRIQVEDVQRVLEQSKEAHLQKPSAIVNVKEKVQLSGVRKAVAERLSHSFHTVVPVMLTAEVDFEGLEEARKKLVPTVSVTAFLVKAVAVSLREHLILNSSLEGEQITVYDDINVAVAIDTPDGLTAPVVFGPEDKSVAEISKDIEDLKEKASSAKLTIQDLTGGTFTVTNLGGQGVEIFAPIINPPQAAILAIGRSSKKPVVLDDSIKIRTRATISLMFDHRITDGVPASKFLVHVKKLLENPNSLLGSERT